MVGSGLFWGSPHRGAKRVPLWALTRADEGGETKNFDGVGAKLVPHFAVHP